jgi:hypothetical protein
MAAPARQNPGHPRNRGLVPGCWLQCTTRWLSHGPGVLLFLWAESRWRQWVRRVWLAMLGYLAGGVLLDNSTGVLIVSVSRSEAAP